MAPEPTNKPGLLPRFGSKYRYSGRTFYESKYKVLKFFLKEIFDVFLTLPDIV